MQLLACIQLFLYNLTHCDDLFWVFVFVGGCVDVSVIAKSPVLPSCAVDGHYRNPLLLLLLLLLCTS